jgi:hypothetical protein
MAEWQARLERRQEELEALRASAQATAAKREQELDARDKAVAAEEAAQRERARAAEDLEARRAREAADKEAALGRWEGELAALDAELAARAREVTDERSRLGEGWAALEKRGHELAAAEARALTQLQDAEGLQGAARMEREQLEGRETRLAASEAALEGARRELARKQDDVAAAVTVGCLRGRLMPFLRWSCRFYQRAQRKTCSVPLLLPHGPPDANRVVAVCPYDDLAEAIKHELTHPAHALLPPPLPHHRLPLIGRPQPTTANTSCSAPPTPSPTRNAAC